MNTVSLVLFLLGSVLAGLYAVGMDPYSCGLPLLLIAMAVAFGSWNRDPMPRARWVYLLIGTTVCYFAWRMLVSEISDFARSDALLLSGVVLAFWWTQRCGGGKMFSRWLAGLWGLVGANVAVAMVQAYRDAEFYPLMVVRATKEFPSGLYLHYNHFANFLLGVGLLSLGYGMAGNMKRWMRVTSFLVYAICVYGIYLAHSRGAWLGLGCGTALVIVGWLANLWRMKTSWAGVALLAATFLAPLLVIGGWKLGTSAVSNRNTGDSGRLEFASIAVDLIQDKPLWGGGSRSFFFDSFKKWNPKELWVGGGDIQYVHNEYLQAAVDYGVVGLILLLGILGVVMFRGVALLTLGETRKQGEAGVALGAMAALCAMGVQAFFSFVYHVLPDVILMGCCVGWLVRQPWALISSHREQDAVPVLSWRLGLMGSVMAMGVMVLAARDAAAWWALYPRADFSLIGDKEKSERYRKAIALRPDFRRMSDYSRILVRQSTADDVSDEQREVLAEQATAALESALKRAPDSYEDLVNLALLYDRKGRLDEAEILYQKALPVLDPREMHYGTRYFYARHLAARATAVWRQRQPEKALVLFHRAKEELSRVAAPFNAADPAVKTMIEKSIAFLEGANIKPENLQDVTPEE
jgi:tetratricopeptide (TPR) repeat protein